MRETRHKGNGSRARCGECGRGLRPAEAVYCGDCLQRFKRLGLQPLDGPPNDTPTGRLFYALHDAIAAAGGVEAFSLARVQGRRGFSLFDICGQERGRR